MHKNTCFLILMRLQKHTINYRVVCAHNNMMQVFQAPSFLWLNLVLQAAGFTCLNRLPALWGSWGLWPFCFLKIYGEWKLGLYKERDRAWNVCLFCIKHPAEILSCSFHHIPYYKILQVVSIFMYCVYYTFPIFCFFYLKN